MSLEIHNQTLYRGMSDMMYRTIDREVRAALVFFTVHTLSTLFLSFKSNESNLYFSADDEAHDCSEYFPYIYLTLPPPVPRPHTASQVFWAPIVGMPQTPVDDCCSSVLDGSFTISEEHWRVQCAMGQRMPNALRLRRQS